MAQPFQITSSEIARPALIIAEIAGRHDPKRPNGGERARFGPTQPVRLLMHVDVFALTPARQIQAGCQRVARVEILGLAAFTGTRLSRVERAGIGRSDIESPNSPSTM